jgi:hypothetical protein
MAIERKQLRKTIKQTSHGFVSGDIGKFVYYTGSSYSLAIANDFNKIHVIGCISKIISSNEFELSMIGDEISVFTGLTTGSMYYLSNSVLGGYSINVSIAENTFQIPLFIAIDSTTGYLVLNSYNDNNTTDGTGHYDRNQSQISFDETTRIFTIQPKSPYTYFDIYYKGNIKRISSTKTLTIPNTSNLHYIYFDQDGELQSTTIFTYNLLYEFVLTASVHWNTSAINTKKLSFGDERHGIIMDYVTHSYLHFTRGASWESGLAIGNYTITENGNLNSHSQFSLSSGIIRDEDIIINIVDSATPDPNNFEQILSPIANIPIFYRLGTGNSNWERLTETPFVTTLTGGASSYNLDTAGTWSLASVTNNNYLSIFIIATNDINRPIIAITGQRQDTSLTNAQLNNTYDTLQLGTIPVSEWKPIYRLIFQCSTNYGNTPKNRLRHVLDLRTSIQMGNGNVTLTSHGNLSGLSDSNQHPASSIYTDTTNFNNFLNATDDTVQKVLDKVDAINNVSLNLRYKSSNGQTMTNGTSTIVKFETLVFDSNTAYNITTGLFTCPITGIYSINSKVTTSNVSYSIYLEIYVNDTLYSIGNKNATLAVYGGQSEGEVSINDIVSLTLNDTVSIKLYNNSGASLTLKTSDLYNYLSIYKV